MTWYALRTAAGYQMPYRERWPEPSASALNGKPRGRGYTVASAIQPDRSRIEAALSEARFTHYMPVEFMSVRNRDKRGTYELRRFALLKGYIFVGDIEDGDWLRLMKVPGVKSVVAIDGEPYPISTMDLFRLRMYEQNSKAEAIKNAEGMSRGEQRLAREQKKTIIKGARRKLFPGRDVKLIWGDKAGREATVQAWNDQDEVRVLLHNLDAADELVTVPYEFLKAS